MGKDIAKTKKESTVIVNVLIWTIILCLPYLAYISGVRIGNFTDYLLLLRLPVTVVTVYYVNYYFLVDRFLVRERTWLFIFWNIILIFSVMFLELVTSFPLSAMPPPEDAGLPVYVSRPMSFQLVNILLYLCALGAAVAFRMIRWWYEEEERRKEQEHSRISLELQNLKNQLNPHFLFNVLNNIYSFIGTDTVRARRSMDSLCDLLRYTLYRSERSEVAFSEEVSFVRDYIGLAKERLPEDARLSVDLPDSPSDTAVTPMLFITLVENAFKHGVRPGAESFVSISLKESGGRIVCAVENSFYAPVCGDGQVAAGGIGLENLQKRLDLIYEGRYVFRNGVNENGVWSSYLKIDTGK